MRASYAGSKTGILSLVGSGRAVVSPYICLALFFILGPASVLAQSPVTVTGTVVDSQTGEPVPFVHIYSLSSRHGTVADDQGRFFLTVGRVDTIAFSSVGYEVRHFHPGAEGEKDFYEVRLQLMPKVYQLNPVNVTAYPSIEQFKQDVLAMEIPEETKFELRIPKGYTLPPEGPGDVNLNPTLGISGPVSALYNAFSREAKEKRKLKTLRENIKDYRLIDAKYNIEVVKQITDLDDEGAKRFMEWCTFEDEFILKSSAYDLAVAMLKCLDEFARADTLR